MGQLEEKFGFVGKKGEEGEVFALTAWRNLGYEVIDYRYDIMKQKVGIDYAIRKLKPTPWKRYYTVDNKNNLQYNKGEYTIPIEVTKGKRRPGWLHTSSADRISHTHVKRKKLLYYDLGQMRTVVLPLLRSKELEPITARSKCKIVYIQATDSRIAHLIRTIDA